MFRLITLLLFCASRSLSLGKPSAVMPDRHMAIFENYCLDCHDAETRKGQINLEDLSFDLGSDVQMAERWQEVLGVLNAGEMPPEDKDQLTQEEKTELLADLSEKLVVARKIHADNGGVIAMRRLNQREYANTVESLIGVRPEVEGLPTDHVAGGFDTAGASLYLSSDQFEQYVSIARSALETALGNRRAVEPSIIRTEAENKYYSKAAHQELLDEHLEGEERGRKFKEAFKANRETKPEDYGFKSVAEAHSAVNLSKKIAPVLEDYLKRPEIENGYIMMALNRRIRRPIKLPQFKSEVGEEVTIRFRAARYPDAPERFQYVEIVAHNWTDNTSTNLWWRKVRAPLDSPETIELTTILPPGKRMEFQFSWRSQQVGSKRNDRLFLEQKDQHHTPMGVWLDWVELERKGRPATPTDAMARLMPPVPKGAQEGSYAREVIERFATEAFRGTQPSGDYIDKLVGLFEANRAKGQKVEQALLQPMSIILASPSFLYMVESTGGERLSEFELAVRLSYFLWSAPPDAELMSLAENGRLSDPEELSKQTTRLLRDHRADRFIRDFAYQWLEMDRLGIFPFDTHLYQEFDNAVLHQSAEEIYQTLRHFLDKRLPLDQLIKSDFVVANDVMADFYGLPPVDSHEFRPVKLPKASPRGGLMGSAAILGMGSNGKRSSPVERGAWVLRHILNDPPPPAPPNVPQLERLDDEILSSRQLGIAHQEEPQCVQCHRKIDPIGYAMENFDAAGQWRESEVIRYGKRYEESKTFPIDPKGQFADGTQFTNFFELRDMIASHGDDFARGFTEALIAYGLGRPYGFSDYELADSILKQSKEKYFAIDRLIHALVQSPVFQSK